jgi:predicted transcriptional regulator
MDYKTFDSLGNKKNRNKIIAFLKKEAHTFDEIGKAVELDRTSVFYHVKEMEKEGKIIKRFVGRLAYVGLIQKER